MVLGGEVNAVLGEVSGEALASAVGVLVALADALLYVRVGFSGLAFWGFGQVVQSLLAVLLVAFVPLAQELWGGFVVLCGFAVVLGVLVDVDGAFACFGRVYGVYLLMVSFIVGVCCVVRVVGAVLQEVRLFFSSVGRGWAAGAGVNDVLAHAPPPLDTPEGG